MAEFSIYEVAGKWRGYISNTHLFFDFPGADLQAQLQAARDFAAAMNGGTSDTIQWMLNNLNDPLGFGSWDNFQAMRTFNVMFSPENLDVGITTVFDTTAWAAREGKSAVSTLADALGDDEGADAISAALLAIL